MKRTLIPFSMLMLSLSVQPVAIAGDMNMSNMNGDSASSSRSTATAAVGIVEAIDEANGIVKISHEAIKSLDWPAMTMNFTVKDTKLMNKLGKGKKIQFWFIQQKGKYLVVDVQ